MTLRSIFLPYFFNENAYKHLISMKKDGSLREIFPELDNVWYTTGKIVRRACVYHYYRRDLIFLATVCRLDKQTIITLCNECSLPRDWKRKAIKLSILMGHIGHRKPLTPEQVVETHRLLGFHRENSFSDIEPIINILLMVDDGDLVKQILDQVIMSYQVVKSIRLTCKEDKEEVNTRKTQRIITELKELFWRSIPLSHDNYKRP